MGFTVAKFRTIARGLILALGLQLVGLLPALAQDDTIWRELNPENTVVMQLHEGEVYIELNPLFAPKTVKRFKELIDDRFYNALTFYRVIDGFVAQGGDQSDVGLPSSEPTLDGQTQPCRRRMLGRIVGIRPGRPSSDRNRCPLAVRWAYWLRASHSGDGSRSAF